MRAWLFALTFALFCGAMGCNAAAPPPGAPQLSLRPGGEARLSNIGVLDLDRASRSVDGVRAGRVALVTFWATWCEACEKEFAALNRLNERATGEKAVVIGVAVGEPSAKVRGFVEQHGLKYAQLVDEDFLLTDALGQRTLPATLIVSRTGEVVYKGGMLGAEALAAFRKAIADETAGATASQ